jgi:DNA-binding NtrC family response regulator
MPKNLFSSAISEAILLVDWSPDRSKALCEALSSFGLDVQHAEGIEGFIRHNVSVALIPARWPSNIKPKSQDSSRAITLLRELRSLSCRPEVIVFGCNDDCIGVTEACQCLLEGARHLIDTSDPSVLAATITLCLESRRAAQVESYVQNDFQQFGVIYGSDLMHQLLRKLSKVATIKNATVLLTGPTGSGKQKLAEMVHRMDPWRRNAPMITLNCATIPASLAESELFGHRRGSYTGATADRMGCFRTANGGTLVLDEIGELDLSLQPKLLRALEERKIRSLGQDSEVAVDVRVIATTNCDLRSMVQENRFRMDLYQRLAMVELAVPPLSSRSQDIELLMKFFISKHRDIYKGDIRNIHRYVIDVLSQYAFKGNVRELENLVRYILFNKIHGDTIQVEDLPKHVLEGIVYTNKQIKYEEASGYLASRIFRDKMSLSEVLAECESIMIKAALELTNGNRSAAAGLLGISERTLYNKLQHCSSSLVHASDEPAMLADESIA